LFVFISTAFEQRREAKKVEKRLQRPVETDALLPPTPMLLDSENAGEPPALPGIAVDAMRRLYRKGRVQRAPTLTTKKGACNAPPR